MTTRPEDCNIYNALSIMSDRVTLVKEETEEYSVDRSTVSVWLYSFILEGS